MQKLAQTHRLTTDTEETIRCYKHSRGLEVKNEKKSKLTIHKGSRPQHLLYRLSTQGHTIPTLKG